MNPEKPAVANPLLTTRWSVCGMFPPDKRLGKTDRFHQLKFNEEWKRTRYTFERCLPDFFFFHFQNDFAFLMAVD